MALSPLGTVCHCAIVHTGFLVRVLLAGPTKALSLMVRLAPSASILSCSSLQVGFSSMHGSRQDLALWDVIVTTKLCSAWSALQRLMVVA